MHSLRRLDKVAGILAQQSLRDGRPDKAINVVRDQVIPQLRKFQIQADADTYDLHAKSACSDFRIILERTIEFILLNDVVIRFRRDVMTKGKLRGVAKVNPDDCDFLDDLMTNIQSMSTHKLMNSPRFLLSFKNSNKMCLNSLNGWGV